MNRNNRSGRDLAAQRHASLSRRRFLRGLGVCMALPAFESLMPRGSLALGAEESLGGTTAAGAPLRMAMVYFPNGAIQDKWLPSLVGNEIKFNESTKPMAAHKDDLQFIMGLEHKSGLAGTDGGGDHARANATFLTGVRIKKTAGDQVHAGVSIDQVAAQHIGHLTRFSSLELTCDAIRKSGVCDTGYSCIYQHNLSWRSPTAPMPPEANPRLVFERLFGAGNKGERTANYLRRQEQERPILDFVMEDAKNLEDELSSRDRQKLDDYLTSIHEIDKRITQLEQFKHVPDPDAATPDGVPDDHELYVQVMFGVMMLAFQTDSTRIATLMLAGDGNNRPFPEIGVAEGHHFLTHHGGDEDKIAKVAQIDHWYALQFSKFMDQMKQAKDLDGNSILDNSMVLFGSGLCDGNRHTHSNLPIILAGRGGGTLNPGRIVKLDATPATNLFLSMTDRLGVPPLESFGDSTGRVKDL
jgi:hypothetical protein